MSHCKPRTIVLVALVLRLAVIFAGHTYRINPRNHFQSFGFEMGRVARSIAQGQGFSSPFDLPTGPTAVVPPGYPYLLAGIFKIFGVYSRGSAVAILALDSLFSALVCAVIYGIARQVFARSDAGALAASSWGEAQGSPGEGAGAHPNKKSDPGGDPLAPVRASTGAHTNKQGDAGGEGEGAGAHTNQNQRLTTSDQRPITSDDIARWCAWTWALFPYAIYWPVRMIWETSLSALLMSLAVWQTLRIESLWTSTPEGAPAPRELPQWLLMGLIWGAMALTNPALLAIAPVSLIWLAVRGRLRVAPVVAGIALSVAITAPWMVRNYRVFHRLMLRDNFWMEVWISNNPRANGLWTRTEHPGNDSGALVVFQRMGERNFMDAERVRAEYFIRQHTATFLAWSFQRVFYFWTGEPKEEPGGVAVEIAKRAGFGLWTLVALLGLWLMSKREPYAAGFIAGILAIYPIAYYITRASPRYRHPIEPLLVMLTVYAVWVASQMRKARDQGIA